MPEVELGVARSGDGEIYRTPILMRFKELYTADGVSESEAWERAKNVLAGPCWSAGACFGLFLQTHIRWARKAEAAAPWYRGATSRSSEAPAQVAPASQQSDSSRSYFLRFSISERR
jgi:hypothetical protein